MQSDRSAIGNRPVDSLSLSPALRVETRRAYGLSERDKPRIIRAMKEGIPFFAILAAYLCGAIPFAFIIARARGVDIRAVGSGNVGATNVFRSVGKPWGVLTFLLDALKGFIPALAFPAVAHNWEFAAPDWLGLACGAAAIAGHTWPIWLGFKGGKGVATGAGALLAVAPWAFAAGLAAWLLVFLLSRYVSLASILAAASAAAAGWVVYGREPARPIVLSVLAALVVVRHRSNVRRLLAGTELRAGASRVSTP